MYRNSDKSETIAGKEIKARRSKIIERKSSRKQRRRWNFGL